MKIINKELVKDGKFLNFFHYKLDDGRNYEVVSRSKTPNPYNCDAVDIIAFSPSFQKICVIKEYRVPLEGYIIAFPAGLREQDEALLDTAKRELNEECNLHLDTILDALAPSAQSAGMTDETVATVICVASGDPSSCNQTADEDITPMWITREEAQKLLSSGVMFSGRCQMFLMMWSNFVNTGE